MSKFSFAMPKDKAILEVKRAINGKVAILKDKGNELVVGAPFMTATISFKDGYVETSAALVGKVVIGTVDSAIELTEGFTKV